MVVEQHGRTSVKMNLFYCNGNVPIIAANCIMKQQYSDDYNILILERNNKSGEKKVIEDCLTQNMGWSKIHIVDVNVTYVRFLDLSWPISLIKHFYSGVHLPKRRRKTTNEIKKILNIYPRINNYFISDNANFTKYVFKNEIENLWYIEHGVSSYRFQKSKNNQKIISKFLNILLGASNTEISRKIYLTDGEKSYPIKNFEENNNYLIPKSIKITREIKHLYKIFLENLKYNSLSAYDELVNISKIYTGKKLYIYHPTEGVGDDEYQDFLRRQLDNSNNKDVVFIIKPHSNDRVRDYGTYFSNISVDNYQFKNTIILDIPVEFLLIFFTDSVLYGTYSSAHFYSRWWLDKTSIISNTEIINNGSQRRIIEDAYSVVSREFTDECNAKNG